MPPERKQISVWINTESAALLSSIAKERGQPLARIIELAIAAYSTSDQTSEKTSGQLVDYVWRNTIDDLRTLIADHGVRLCAIETAIMSGLGGRDAKVRVTVNAAENEPMEADNDDSLHPADPLPTAQEFNQDKDQFRAEVVKFYQQGVTSSPDILKILNEQGYRNSKGNSYYRNDVRQALKDAGLVEQGKWAE